MGGEAGPVIVIADAHLGLLAGQRVYGVRNDSQCDALGLAGFFSWLERLESKTVTIDRGEWKGPLEV